MNVDSELLVSFLILQIIFFLKQKLAWNVLGKQREFGERMKFREVDTYGERGGRRREKGQK